MKKTVLIFMAAAFFVSSAASAAIDQRRLDKISLGMKIDQIVKALGEPDSRRAAGVDSEGRPMEILEYGVTRRLKEADDQGNLEVTDPYLFVTAGGALVRIDRQR